MNEIRFPWFRSGYVAAAVCLGISASCTLPITGLIRAFMTVGTDVQLPLERIVTDNQEPELAQSSNLPQRLHTSASEAPHAQSAVHARQNSSHRADTNPPAPGHTPGYQRTNAGFQYWT